MTSNKLPNINELSRRAKRIYDTIPKGDLDAHSGKFIAIEIDSEEHFFGDTKDDAVAQAKAKHQNKLIFIRPVGQIEKIQTYAKFNNPMNTALRAL